MTILLLGGWIGAHSPLSDLGYLDLNYGRRIAETGDLTPPVVKLASEDGESPTSWLGSRLLYFTYQLGGETGVRVWAALSIALGSILLYAIRPGTASFLVVIAATSIAGSAMEISTCLATWPLLAGLFFLLASVRNRTKWWALALPPFLFFWASANGEIALGLLFIGFVLLDQILGPIVETARRRKSPRFADIEPLLYLTGAVLLSFMFLALFLPGGTSSIQNPFRAASLIGSTGTSGWAPTRIGENPLFFIFAVLTAALTRRLPLARALPEVLTMVGLAFSALVSEHFVITFAAAAALPAAHSLDIELKRLASSPASMARWLTNPALAIFVGLAFAIPRVSDDPPSHPFSGSMSRVAEEDLNGSLFNTPQAGGLAGWAGGKKIFPFADLRPQSLGRYVDMSAEGKLLKALAAPETMIAVIDWDFASAQLEPETMDEAGFLLISFDDSSMLFARPGANPQAVPGLALYHFNPLTTFETLAPEAVPLIARELADYLQFHPPSVRALQALGSLLLAEQRKEEALEAFEAARALSPNDLTILRNLSQLYLDKGMYRLAERTSLNALQLSEEEQFTNNLALALYGQGRNEEAARWFEENLKSNPDNLAALRSLVDIYRQLEKPRETLEHKQVLEQLEESTVKALVAEALTKKGELDFRGAAAAYQRAHQIHPGDTEILWKLSLALLTQNEIEMAANVLREILAQDDGHQLAQLTLGSLCARQLDCAPDEAKKHLEAFLKLAPEDANAGLARDQLAALGK